MNICKSQKQLAIKIIKKAENGATSIKEENIKNSVENFKVPGKPA